MSSKKIVHAASSARIPAVAVLLALAVTLALLQAADAKRGCMAFGHSCFGGHGKRADMEPGAEGVVAMSAPDEAAVADVEAAATLLDDMGPLQRLRLSPFLRQWLQRAYQQQLSEPQGAEVK